ncbi:MAG: hypothetical protein U0Y10_04565 [Spirosomataceae bacterium]
MKTIIIATNHRDELKNFNIIASTMWGVSNNQEQQIIAIYIARESAIDHNVEPYLKLVQGDAILLYHNTNYTRLKNIPQDIIDHDCGTGGNKPKTKNREQYEELINTQNPLDAFDKAWDFFFREDPDEIKLNFLHDIYGGKSIQSIEKDAKYKELIASLNGAFDTFKSELGNSDTYINKDHIKALTTLRDAVLPEK